MPAFMQEGTAGIEICIRERLYTNAREGYNIIQDCSFVKENVSGLAHT